MAAAFSAGLPRGAAVTKLRDRKVALDDDRDRSEAVPSQSNRENKGQWVRRKVSSRGDLSSRSRGGKLEQNSNQAKDIPTLFFRIARETPASGFFHEERFGSGVEKRNARTKEEISTE